MIVYFLLLLVTTISLIIHKKDNKTIFSIIPYLAMAFVSGFRCEVGADYDTYRYWFYDILEKKGWYSNTEPGFKLLTYFVNSVGGNYQLVLFVMAVLTSYFYYDFIKNNSSNFEMSTMVYMCFGMFYLSSFNGSRQAFAISIFLYAIKYLSNKDIAKYELCIIIASLFHASAFVFVLTPLIYKIKSNYVLAYIELSVLGIVIIKGRILDLILSLFPAYKRYTGYSYAISKGYLLFMILGILILLLCSTMRICIEPIYMYLFVFSLTLITIAILTQRYGMFLTRYASWGMPSLLVVIPRIAGAVKPSKIFRMVVYSMCYSYFLMTILNGNMMLPYKFNFSLF